MINLLRPRVIITLFVWVVTCCGLLIMWQVPLPPSSSSSSSSSSSYDSANARDFFLPRSSYNKPVPHTHVSNLLYLQSRDKQSIQSPPLPRPSAAILQSKQTDGDEKSTSNARLYPKAKSYPKISFRNKRLKMAGSPSSADYRGPEGQVLPINDPITSHRSRVRDATPTKSGGAQASIREQKRQIVQRHLRHDNAKPSKEPDLRKQRRSKNQGRRNSKENRYRAYEEDRDDTYKDEYEKGAKGDDEEEDDYPTDEYDDVDLGGRFNVTPSEVSLLVYNRIPKCASSTMQTILRRLSRHLNFEHVSSLIYNQHQLSEDEQEKLVENLTASITSAPSHALSYDRHLYYTNFTGLGMDQPVYINVVRDPVERFISSFYYRRSEERLNRIQMHGRSVSPSFSWVNRSVEQCVLLNDTECSFPLGEEKEMILSYFCGHHEFCRIVGSQDARQAAKQVVSKEYSVVGLVEHMDLSLLLMETLVPRFMDGASQIYENIRQREHMAVNVNQQKPKVSVNVREELLRRMSDDMDFYRFLEQRLFEQKKNFLSKK